MAYKSNFIAIAIGGAGKLKLKLSELDINLVVDGDSTFKGTNNCGDINNRFANELAANIFPQTKSLTFTNVAVSGQTTKNMLRGDFTDASLEVISGRFNVLVAGESINAILNYDYKGDADGAATGQINFDDLKLYDEKMRAAGYDMIIRVTSYYPRKINSSGYNRAEWTSEVRARQKDYYDLVETANETSVNKTWDALVQLRESPTLGGPEEQLIDVLRFEDSVHLLCLGQKDMADYVYETGILPLFQE